MEELIKEWGKKAAEFEAASKNEMALPFFRLTYEIKAIVYRDCLKDLQSALAKSSDESSNCNKPHVSVAVAVEEILKPKYMNDVYTWKQIQDAINKATER